MEKLWVLVALCAMVVAVPSQEPECIKDCKCTFDSPYVMKVTRCTKDINLSDNVFANLGMEDVNTVEFAGVVIRKIGNDAFTALKNLEILSFRNSHIQAIQEDAFDLLKIGKISFNGCSFNGTAPLFNSDQVTEVMMTKCSLTTVPEFGDLPSLELLDLSHNYIKKVNKDAFKVLGSLETINLSYNNITMFPPGLFHDNPTLSSLNLDHNPLKLFRLDSELGLESLSLKSCKLTTFDGKTAKYLNTLTDLYLSGNKIAFFPNEAIANMTDLSVLDLSGNNLKHLDANVFKNNLELQKVVLDNNFFKTLPPFAIINGTFPIAYFSCKACGLIYLSKDTFKHMPSIQILDLSHNFLDTVDNVLNHIPSLIQVDLTYNEIARINANTFSDNRNLKTIKLKGNPISHMNPKVFSSNAVLSLLDVSETDLTEIWSSNKTKIPSLKTLIISNNKIKDLNPADLKVTPNLKYIYLEKNRFACTKNFKDSLRWLNSNDVFRIVEIERDQSMKDFINGNVKTWIELGKDVCQNDNILGVPEKVKEIKVEESEDDDVDIDVGTSATDDYTYDDFYDYYEDEDTTTSSPNAVHKDTNVPTMKNMKQPTIELEDYEDLAEEAQMIELDEKYTLTKTSYAILVTAIFTLTALLVVFVTVSLTMLILKKNRHLHMERANLPRFKIPLWSTNPTQKKHSGSVYQNLTEDYSGLETPKINRYEFKSTPTVHMHPSA